MKRIPGYPACFGCGKDNARGLHLELFREGKRVSTGCRLPLHFAGYPGVAHGGVLATLLDEVMTWAAVEAAGRWCLTGELQVRFLRPAPVQTLLRAWGEPVERRKGFLLCRGQVEDEGGAILVRGEGKFFPGSPEAFPPA